MDNILKVYQVDDLDYWVTDTLENLKIAYKETTGEEIDEDVLSECDLDDDGMYWDFDTIPEMGIVIKLLMEQINSSESHITVEMDGKNYYFNKYEEYSMYVSFRRALELDNEYKVPHVLASTPY